MPACADWQRARYSPACADRLSDTRLKPQHAIRCSSFLQHAAIRAVPGRWSCDRARPALDACRGSC
eukprot:6177547-Pleurochrysis_carterae.AAC.1